MKIMSYVFWRVSSSIKLQPEKNTTRKKRYSCLAVGWNKSQITVCCLKRQTPTITGKNYDWKKGTVVWPLVGIHVKIRTPTTTGKNYDLKKKDTVVLLTPFATHVTFYFYYKTVPFFSGRNYFQFCNN